MNSRKPPPLSDPSEDTPPDQTPKPQPDSPSEATMPPSNPRIKDPRQKSRIGMVLIVVVGGLFVASFILGDDSDMGRFINDLAELLWQQSGELETGVVIGDPAPIPPPADAPTPSDPGADDSTPDNPTPGARTLPGLTPRPPDDWYRIYFTSPNCGADVEQRGGIDETIAADLAQATEQVDIAAFELESEPITNALIDLEKRGVIVRAVTDSDYAGESSIRRLRRNGVSVVEDKRSGLMHNKFIVIDRRIVWTGSLNFTANGVYCNNNNSVRFDAPDLAANYSAEMDEMYEARAFGPDSPDTTPNERLTIHDVAVENYFAPERELVNTLARAVVRAEDEILVMAFSFTSPEIGESMLGRAEAGVTLRAIFEKTGSETLYSYFPQMSEAGLANVQVRQDANKRIMHHKVVIVDRQTVIFGSFNFSESANRKNDENIIIVHDADFARFFVDEFLSLWAEANLE